MGASGRRMEMLPPRRDATDWALPAFALRMQALSNSNEGLTLGEWNMVHMVDAFPGHPDFHSMVPEFCLDGLAEQGDEKCGFRFCSQLTVQIGAKHAQAPQVSGSMSTTLSLLKHHLTLHNAHWRHLHTAQSGSGSA